MLRTEWYSLFRDIRTPVVGENLFPRDQMAGIALLVAKEDRKEAWKQIMKERSLAKQAKT